MMTLRTFVVASMLGAATIGLAPASAIAGEKAAAAGRATVSLHVDGMT